MDFAYGLSYTGKGLCVQSAQTAFQTSRDKKIKHQPTNKNVFKNLNKSLLSCTNKKLPNTVAVKITL